MTYATYREMPYLISNLIPFRGNSVTAIRQKEGAYVVTSYETTILEVVGGNVTYMDNSYFSATTSKLQNIIIRAFYLNNGICKRGDEILHQ